MSKVIISNFSSNALTRASFYISRNNDVWYYSRIQFQKKTRLTAFARWLLPRQLVDRRALPDSRAVVVPNRAYPLDAIYCVLQRVFKRRDFPGEAALRHWMETVIGRAPRRAHRHADVLIGSFFVAKPLFQAIQGRRVLNHPICHLRYLQGKMREEASRVPAFAGTLPVPSAGPFARLADVEAEIDLADLVLVGSEFARQTFLAEGVPDAKLQVCPYGVDERYFCERRGEDGRRPQDGKVRLIFAGQLSQRKGLSYLLEAFTRLDSRRFALTLVGSPVGDAREILNAYPDVHVVGHLGPEDLIDAYLSSDIFVFPTLAEGLGLVVLEAMACGLPVVTTDNGPGEVVRDGKDGYVVPERDAAAIADRIERLADRDHRLGLAAQARDRARQFTWDRYGEEMAATVAELSVRP